MSVGVYVSLVGLLRSRFGVTATTYGLLDSSLDIAKCFFRLVKQETHFLWFLGALGGRFLGICLRWVLLSSLRYVAVC